VTSESPAGSDTPREIVDQLEEKVSDEAGPGSPTSEDETGTTDAQGDVAPEVPGSPEPTD
jgi:hypothetical protein